MKNTNRFIMLCSIYLMLFICIPDYRFEPLTHLIALMVGGILHIMGITVHVFESYVSSATFQIQVVPGCTPMIPVIIFTAFVQAHCHDIGRTLNEFISGVFILFAVNLLRLVITFIVSMNKPGLFDITHVYFGQLLTSGILVGLCFRVLQSDNDSETTGSPLSFFFRISLILGILVIPTLYCFPFYIRAVDHIVSGLFGVFGCDAHMELKPDGMPLSVFDVVMFCSLMLASESIKNRTVKLITGFMVLSILQLTMDICLMGNHIHPGVAWVIGFRVFSVIHVMFPFMMWIAAVSTTAGHGHVPIQCSEVE